jgi:hypothetical protein
MNSIKQPYSENPHHDLPVVRTIQGTKIEKDGEYFRFHGGFGFFWLNSLEDAVSGLNELNGSAHAHGVQDGEYGALD